MAYTWPWARELSSQHSNRETKSNSTHSRGLVVGHRLLLESDPAVERVHETHGVELDLHVLRRVSACTTPHSDPDWTLAEAKRCECIRIAGGSLAHLEHGPEEVAGRADELAHELETNQHSLRVTATVMESVTVTVTVTGSQRKEPVL